MQPGAFEEHERPPWVCSRRFDSADSELTGAATAIRLSWSLVALLHFVLDLHRLSKGALLREVHRRGGKARRSTNERVRESRFF